MADLLAELDAACGVKTAAGMGLTGAAGVGLGQAVGPPLPTPGPNTHTGGPAPALGADAAAHRDLLSHLDGLPLRRVDLLTSYLHGRDNPRAAIAAGATPDGRAAAPAAARVLGWNQRVTANHAPGPRSYVLPTADPRTGVATFVRPGGMEGIPEALLLRHEIDHLRQMPATAGPMRAFVDDADRRHEAMGERDMAALRAGRPTMDAPSSWNEIAPSLGDIPAAAEYRRQTRLDRKLPAEPPGTLPPVRFPGGATLDPEWMRQQAEAHGFFRGRSMTQLLTTPEGKAWLRRITDPALAAPPEPPPG